MLQTLQIPGASRARAMPHGPPLLTWEVGMVYVIIPYFFLFLPLDPTGAVRQAPGPHAVKLVSAVYVLDFRASTSSPV